MRAVRKFILYDCNAEHLAARSLMKSVQYIQGFKDSETTVRLDSILLYLLA
jgi:hypothetical protein